MEKEELRKAFLDFKNLLDFYKHLLVKSRNSVGQIHKNIDELERARETLNLRLGGLKQYFHKFSDELECFDIALSANDLIIIGPNLDTSIQFLLQAIGKLDTMDDQEFRHLMNPSEDRTIVIAPTKEVDELVEDFLGFEGRLRSYKVLLENSRNLEGDIVRNVDQVGKAQEELNRLYGGLEKYVTWFTRSTCFKTALSNTNLSARLESIDHSILEIEKTIGRLGSMTTDEIKERMSYSKSEPTMQPEKTLLEKVCIYTNPLYYAGLAYRYKVGRIVLKILAVLVLISTFLVTFKPAWDEVKKTYNKVFMANQSEK